MNERANNYFRNVVKTPQRPQNFFPSKFPYTVWDLIRYFMLTIDYMHPKDVKQWHAPVDLYNGSQHLYAGFTLLKFSFMNVRNSS